MPKPAYGDIQSLEFYPLGDKDVINLSTVTITSTETFANNKNPKPFGVADAHLGTLDYTYPCQTCHCNKNLCPGHTGKVDLNTTIVSPIAIGTVIKYLRIICHKCYKLIDNNVSLSKTTSSRVCKTCGHNNPRIVKHDSGIITFQYGNELPVEVWPSKYKHILEGVTADTLVKLKVSPTAHPKNFILTKLMISSINTRPDVKQIGGTRSSNDPQTMFYYYIIQNNNQIPSYIPENDKEQKLKTDNLSRLLMYIIESCIKEPAKSDVSLSFKMPIIGNDNDANKLSLLRKLTGKLGTIRYHILSKTIYGIARTVIIGDPTIPIDSLIVPLDFAKIIQIEDRVQSYNLDIMQMYMQNAINGIYPACNTIKKKDSGKIFSVKRDKDKVTLELGDIIYRDVITGDWALFNRQPTLFYVSAMRHNIIVSKNPECKTFRMNETICKPYGADFDGDEMNLIFAPNMVAMADYQIMSSVPRFFIGYQHALPHIENIKDTILGIFMLTRSGVILNRHQAMSLFANTTMKPKLMNETYTGRELVSYILPPINYVGSNNYYDEKLAPYVNYQPDEQKIVIRHGKLLSGVLDKKMGRIYQVISTEYGSRQAMTTMFNMQQIALAYLSIHGFSVCLKDIFLSDKAEEEIKHIMDCMMAESKLLTERLLNNSIIPPLGQTVQDYYEMEQLAILDNDFIDPIMSGIDPNNAMLALALCGSTGNLTILKQILACYGQRTIKGKRLPQIMSYKRPNPFFCRFDTRPEARGFIGRGLKHGMKPSEFIGGTQESRIAIISKTMLTATTGAQSRINIKNLESILVTNIGCCESPEGIVQQVFGETGFDPRFLEQVKFSSVSISDAEFEQKYKHDIVEYDQLLKDRNEYRRIFLTLETSNSVLKFNDTQLLPVNTQRIMDDLLYEVEIGKTSITPLPISDMRTRVREFIQDLPYIFYNDEWRVNKRFIAPYCNGALKLTIISIRSVLYTTNLEKCGSLLDFILAKVRSKLTRSLLEYGTAIGMITAMSISEPSTQLVLHSIRADVRAVQSSKSPIQAYKEIVGVVKLDKATEPSMTVQCNPGVTMDKAREIANFIEMLHFKFFVNVSQVFYEQYGQPIHPDYIHEKQILAEFDRIPTNKPPTDLLHWCIRFEINRYSLILKNMTIDQIIYALWSESTHIVYTTDNDAKNIVIRIYLRAISGINTDKKVIEYRDQLLNTIVRGLSGVVSAYVTTRNYNYITPEGLVKPRSIYIIKTNGVNMFEMFGLQKLYPELNYRTLQTDNIATVEKTFGISAAYNTIITEIMQILKDLYYGHYSLIASLMTMLGKCTAVTRSGPNQRATNPLLRIANSGPLRVFEQLITYGGVCEINGICPHLMVGSIPRIGSYYNKIMVNVDFVKENLQKTSEYIDEI